jgi:hypothetical protein
VIDAQSGGRGGRERAPMQRWTKSELTRLRGATDPEIDLVVAAYHREHPALADARDLTDALQIVFAPPRWNDEPRFRLKRLWKAPRPLDPLGHLEIRKVPL